MAQALKSTKTTQRWRDGCIQGVTPVSERWVYTTGHSNVRGIGRCTPRGHPILREMGVHQGVTPMLEERVYSKGSPYCHRDGLHQGVTPMSEGWVYQSVTPVSEGWVYTKGSTQCQRDGLHQEGHPNVRGMGVTSVSTALYLSLIHIRRCLRRKKG